jgi:hypothetical protein
MTPPLTPPPQSPQRGEPPHGAALRKRGGEKIPSRPCKRGGEKIPSRPRK